MYRKKILFIFIFGIVIISILLALSKVSISVIDKDNYFTQECEITNSVEAYANHKSITAFLDYSDTTLNCEEYFSGNIFCFPYGLNNDFDSLEIIFKDEMRAEEFLYSVFTDSIFSRHQNDFKDFNPGRIMSYIIFTEKLMTLNTEKKYKYFYLGVRRYWLNKISNHLIQLMDKKSDLRFDPNFRVIVNRCAQNGFYIPIAYSSIDKVTTYFTQSRYSYVIGRIWLRTSFFQKLAMGSIFVFTIIAYLRLFQFLFKFINSKIQKK